MKTDYSEISLYDILKKGKYEGSIITTYNAFLPFYEEVVLPTLQAGGCRNNVLVMDSRQLKDCINTPSLRPKLAGFEYTLLPIQAPRAFHPKIIFLVGEKKGCVLVGSHNLTISGFRQNREVTSQVKFSSLNESRPVSFAINAWHFIREWIESQRKSISEEFIDSVYKILNLAPWLRKTGAKLADDFQFIGTQINGASLYQQALAKVSGDIKRITVVGPFFDKRLEFIKTLQADFSPVELIVGIDPSTAEIPNFHKKIDDVKFVNATDFGPRATYLHAKIIYIQTRSGEHWLLTGSANPSKPAWLADSGERNAEAVVLHSGQVAKKTAENLKIPYLKRCKEISGEEWNEIERRPYNASGSNLSSGKLILATAGENEIIFYGRPFQNKTFGRAELYNENAELIHSVDHAEYNEENISIPVPEDELRYVRSVKIYLIDGNSFFTWVHHSRELSRRSESSRQAKFRAAMASLDTDDPDLPNLIAIVEKVIFDENQKVDSKAVKPFISRPKNAEKSQPTVKLAVSLDDIQKKKNRRRIVNSGDLGLIMDVLIHNLGIGLKPKRKNPYTKGRDEEDIIGSDDEDVPDIISMLSGSEIVNMSHNKVKNIVTRMLKQFERIQSIKESYHKPIVQLLAVLALFRQLRKFENGNSIIPKSETLVPAKERERLLYGVLPFLYGKNTHFVARAESELIDEPIDEISRLKGLLLWLAKECDVDIKPQVKKGLGIDYDRMRKDSIQKARVLVLAPLAARDAVAFPEAEKSIRQTATNIDAANDWIARHKFWGKNFSVAIEKLKIKTKSTKKKPRIGDLVYLGNPNYDFFNVVYSVSGFSNDVKLVGIEGEDELSLRLKNKLSFYKFPKIT